MGTPRRRLSKVLASALLVAAAACSQVADPVDPEALAAGDATGTVSIWAHQGQQVEVEALQAAVDGFNDSHDEIEADLTFIPEGDYPRTLQTTKPEDLPDVLEFDGPLMASLIYSRKLAPLGRTRGGRRRSTTRRSRCRRRTPTSATTSCTPCRCSTPASGSTATGDCWRRPGCASRPVSTTPGRRRSSRRCWRSSPTPTLTASRSTSRRTTARRTPATPSSRSSTLPASRSWSTTAPRAT